MTEAKPLTRVVRIDALPRDGQTVTITRAPPSAKRWPSFMAFPPSPP